MLEKSTPPYKKKILYLNLIKNRVIQIYLDILFQITILFKWILYVTFIHKQKLSVFCVTRFTT